MQQNDTQMCAELQKESTSLSSTSSVGVSENDICFDSQLHTAYVKLNRISVSDTNSANNLHGK